MKDSECAKRILDWVVREAITASTEYQKALCTESGRVTAEKTWKEYNPDDGVGGFGSNPYSREQEYNAKRLIQSAQIAKEAHEVLEFAKTRICNLTDKKEENNGKT